MGPKLPEVDDMLNQEIYSKKVEEIMSEAEWTVEPLDPLSEALGKMKKHNIQELPVVEKGKLKGLLTFRTLARRRKMPISAQVKSFMISPPKVNPKDPIPGIVEQLINRDFTSLPVTHRADLKGIVSRMDIIELMNDERELNSIPVETIMNFAPTTINGKMGVKKALNMMDLTRESYVAIVDDDRNFIGVVTHSDIVSFLEQPPHKMHTGDFHGEKVHRDRSISSLAKMPETLHREADLKEAIDMMMRLKVPAVHIIDEEGLCGSVSEVDVLEVLLRGKQEEGPFIQIAGIDDAKLMDASELKDVILKSMSKIEKIFGVTAVTVRIRHHHHDSDDDKYTINVKLTTPHEVISREFYDWDLKVAIQSAFSNIEKSLIKEMDKKRNR